MNPEERKNYMKEYRLLNKEKINSYNKQYYSNNNEKLKDYKKNYITNNPDFLVKITENRKNNNPTYFKDYVKKRRINDYIFKLKTNIGNLIRISLKHRKNNKTIDILGLNTNEFKLYLESKFEPWMTWENYGNPKDGILELNKTWDIDHIIPLSSAKTEEEIIKLNHYTNLQPLCSYTNRFIKKG